MPRPCTTANQINNHHVVFSYLQYSLTLPSPDFDNVERFKFNRVVTRSRGGDLIVYRLNSWPKSKTLVYKWANLKKVEREQLIVFLRNTLGQIIQLVDYENNTYSGVITNPDLTVTEQPADFHSAELQFEVQ